MLNFKLKIIMRKLFLFATVCLFAVLLSGCTSNSPESVARKSLQCLIDKDYKGYMDLVYISDKNGTRDEAAIEKLRSEWVQLLEQKVDKEYAKKGGLKSYEITKVEMQEDGQKAKVTAKIKYGDDSEEDTDVVLVKTPEDKWMISLGNK